MATTVDTLLVRIEADLSDLNRSLKKVKKDVDKSSSGIAASFKKIGRAGAVAMAAVVVSQAVRAGSAIITLASDIEEMQGKSKVVFGKFRSQVVNDLEAFGDSIGRSTHELEGMAASIQDTFVPMGFARGEAAKLSVDLTKLAVDVASFNNASDTETMAAFQSALVGNHETVRRFGVIITEATLSQELMRMGIEKGSKAATNAQKVQARMNLIYAGTSDAAGDAARTSDSYANSMRGLKAELSELAGEIGAIVLPAMVKLIAIFRQAATGLREFLEVIGILEKTSEVLSLLSFEDGIEKTLKKVEKLTKKVADAGNSASYAATPGELPLTVQLENARGELNELRAEYLSFNAQEFNKGPSGPTAPVASGTAPVDNKELNDQLDKFEALRKALVQQTFQEENLAKARKSGSQEAIRTALAHIEVTKLQSEFTMLSEDAIFKHALRIADAALAQENAGVKITDSFASIREAAQNIADPLKGVKDQIIELNLAFEAGAISHDVYREALARLKEQLAEVSPMTASLQSAVSTMSQGISSSFADMLMSGKMNLGSLKDIFKGFIKTMIAKAIELFVVNQILNSIFGGFPGFSSMPQGQAFGGSGRAGGGTVQSGQPYMVGERGPELFVPSSAGTVRNNMNSKGSGGAATIVNQTINVSAGVSQTVKAEMMSLLPRFKQDTMSAVVDARQRGGSFGQAFG
tara:strand:- start:415 stop:2496 length:2082 start_codon:yes stop_codon:yes gene_type:complete